MVVASDCIFHSLVGMILKDSPFKSTFSHVGYVDLPAALAAAVGLKQFMNINALNYVNMCFIELQSRI